MSKTRKLIIWSAVTMLLTGAIGCYLTYANGTADYLGDLVTVTAKPVQIPQGFEEAFKDFTGLLLVDKQGQVTAITPKGGNINLCGQGRGPDCKVVLTAYALVDALSATGSCGRCDVGGELTSCHKADRKYSCHITKKAHPKHTCNCS
jgi:hypothetical protein